MVISLIDKIIYASYIALAVITPLLFTTTTTEIYEVPKMFFVYLIATVVLFSTFIITTLRKKLSVPFNLTTLAFVLFLLSQVVSTITSTDKYTSVFGYPTRLNGGLISSVAYFILFTCAVINLNTDKVKNLVLATVFAAVATSIWGIPSHFGYDPSCYVLTGHISSSCWQKEFDPTLRIFSTFGQPNWLASYLVLTLPIAIALALISKKQKRLIFAVSSILIFNALILTNSRAGLLGFAFSAILLPVVVGKKIILANLKLLIPLTLAFALITFSFADLLTSRIRDTLESKQNSQTEQASPSTQTSLTAGGTESGQIRLIVWQGALEIFKNWPFLGPGPETFVNTYYLYRPTSQNNTSEWEFFYNKAHNEFLNYLSTSGSAGFLSFCFLALAIIASCFKTNKKQSNSNLLQKTTAASFVGYLTSIFFGFSTVATQVTFFTLSASAVILSGKEGLLEIKVDYLRNNLLQKLQLVVVAIFFVYVITFVARIYMADFLINKAQNQKGSKSLVTFSSAITTSPVANPYLMADFSYQAALYAKSTNNIETKHTLVEKIKSTNSQITNLSPNNYLLNQKIVKSYIPIIDYSQGEAKQSAARLTQLAPTYPPAYLLLAQTQIALGQKEEALKTVKNLLNLKGDYIEAHELLDQLTIKP